MLIRICGPGSIGAASGSFCPALGFGSGIAVGASALGCSASGLGLAPEPGSTSVLGAVPLPCALGGLGLVSAPANDASPKVGSKIMNSPRADFGRRRRMDFPDLRINHARQ